MLGAPLPPPPADDEVGVEQPSLHTTRVFAAEAPRLGGRRTALRATAHKGRVHTIELTFPDGCTAECSRSLTDTLGRWLGPLEEHVEGRVAILSTEYDTVRVALEVYPARPELVRLLLVCAPLERQAAGQSRIRLERRPPEGEEEAVCRPLPP